MKAIVAVVCDVKQHGTHLYHQAGDKYVEALRRCSDVTPVLIPSLSDPIGIDELVELADAVLFTGGYSNIERHHYNETPAPSTELQDPLRDKNTLHFIPELLSAGMPILGICRGLQELNVALGGSLHPRLQSVTGRMDHREDENSPLEVQYGPAHSVNVQKGGLFESLLPDTKFMVNSLHGQGINTLAAPLRVEALADDNTIEAVSVTKAQNFALAVQWHPEWYAWENPQSAAIFEAFGSAARSYRNLKAN